MLEIIPTPLRPFQKVNLPGSKYIGNRVIMLAGLARGESNIDNVPLNEDMMVACEGLAALGAQVSRNKNSLRIIGNGGVINPTSNYIYTAASGTFSRFIAGACGLGQSAITISGNKKMNTRPMGLLIDALKALGANIESNGRTLPISIKGPFKSGRLSMDGSVSSQFISSVLIAAGAQKNTYVDLEILGEKISTPYIQMTINLMKDFQVWVDDYSSNRYFVRPGAGYMGKNMTIDTDPVSSSYFLGLAAVHGVEITIPHFTQNSCQGESRFPEVLKQMGCTYSFINGALVFKGAKDNLKGITLDMGDMPDVVQTLAIVASYAKGKSKFLNIGHLKHKESDRIVDTCEELKKMGVKVSYTEDSIEVEGGTPHGAVIDTHEDHRMAMSFAIAGTLTPGVFIRNPEVVAKSFPGYWEVLKDQLNISLKSA